MYFVTVTPVLVSSLLIKAKKAGDFSEAMNYILYTADDSTDFESENLLREGKSNVLSLWFVTPDITILFMILPVQSTQEWLG